MKHLFNSLLLISSVSLALCCNSALAQDAYMRPGTVDVNHTTHARNGMTATPRNFKWFTKPTKNTSPEALTANADFLQHPEAGLLFAETPCDNCYEMIGQRTETTKTFLKEGKNPGGSKTIYEQTSNEAMHYKDAQGNWMTIKTQLEPDANNSGVFAAYHQPIPTAIHTTSGDIFSSIGEQGKGFKFNHDLELIYAKPGVANVSLGNADWTNYTAGDDGVYVTNAWPGVDIEIYVMRGAMKTNYIINHAMPTYADGQLLVRDHLLLDNGLSLYASGEKKHKGILEIRNGSGEMKYAMSEATVWEKHDLKKTFKELDYYIGDNNTIDIALPGDFLNRAATSYPVIIDPLVSTLTSAPLAGSSYSAGWVTGCIYANAANVPANCTVTDIQFTMDYTTTGGAIMTEGAFSIYRGACHSPGAVGGSWSCYISPFAGTCTASPASAYSIFSDIGPCVPPPACASYPLNMTLDLYQNYLTTPPCVSTYVYGSAPFVVTVIGHTVEVAGAGASASPSTICSGSPSTLTGTGTYGVPPYTYSWSPGSLTGSPATVSPTATTSYVLTVTDACGITATASTTVTVNDASPITGVTSMCLGTGTTLSDATPGGTWSSSNPSVATINSTGDVTSVTVGTSLIVYTTAMGCTNSVVVNVTLPAAPITGTGILCAGSTITLSDAVPGGTWSSGSLPVATVGAASGVVSGLTPGTAVITYGTSPGCFVTTTVTVNLLAPITGLTTVCVGTTTNLSDAVPGGTWSSSAPAIAPVDASGMVSGLVAGTAAIVYTVPSGCASTAIVTVTLPTPILGNLAVCLGNTTALSNASIVGTWTSSNAAVAPIGNLTGLVTALSVGTSTISYVSLPGCVSSAVVTVNPLPDVVTGTLVVCANSTTLLSDITPGGTWSSDNTTVATISGGSGVVTGVSGGTAGITYTLPTSCIATTQVTVNPLPAAIGGALNICKGATTTLTDATAGGTWSSSNSGVASIDATGLVNGVSTGSTMITYTLGTGCLITATFIVNAIPVAPGTTNLDLCQLTSPVAQLTATSATGSSLQWYTSPSGGAFAASVTPDVTLPGITTWFVSQVVNGCEGPRAPLSVTVHHHMPFTIAATTLSVCQGDSLNFAYLGNSFTGEKFEWAVPSSSELVIGRLIDSSITLRFDTTAGHNYVMLTVGDGYTPCDIKDTVSVNVIINVPPVSFYVKPDVCAGDEVIVALNNNPMSITDYKWDFDTANIVTSSSNHGGPFTIQWPNPGKHLITLTAIASANCPFKTIYDTVEVHAYPDARIAPLVLLKGKNQVCIGDSVLFSPLHYAYGNSYVWSPAHFFEQNNSDNIYGRVETAGPVKLTVTDPYGCTSTDNVQINAQPCCTVFFPNAFTPGADKNNIFRPITTGNHTVHIFRIANRWGQTVFESATEDRGWDGTYNGIPQDIGTYYYFITYDCSGDKHQEKGEVTLVR